MCNEGVKCYVSVTHGGYGIVLAPLIHPEATDVSTKLASLISNLPDRRNRPVYLCVRSYQAWLEPVLADLGAQGADRQAVMVKHLARMLKEGQTAAKVPAGVSVQPSRVSSERPSLPDPCSSTTSGPLERRFITPTPLRVEDLPV